MDSVLGEDQTLPLDFSYNPDMFLSSVADTSDTQSHHQGPPSEGTNNDDSNASLSTGKSSGRFVNGRMSPSNNRNMKEYGTQISDLKKENFSLKLRIFYMEERMMEQFGGDHEQLWKTNIELKVDCDSLRKELGEKHDLLVKASNAVACLEGGNPEEARKIKLEADREVAQMRELMNDKLAEAEKDLQAAHDESEQALDQALKLKKELLDLQQENRDLTDALLQANEALEDAKNRQTENSLAELSVSDPSINNQNLQSLQQQLADLNNEMEDKNRIIAQLQNSLTTKQTLIELLNDEKDSIDSDQTQVLSNEIETLKEKLKKSESALEKAMQSDDKSRQEYENVLILQDEYQDHITEQQQRLDEFELATRQMSEELDKREIEVKDLKDALKDAEDVVEELSSKLKQNQAGGDLQEQLDRTLKDLNMRDRAIAGLTKVVGKKDEEIATLTKNVDQLVLEVDSLKFELETKESKAEEMLRDLRRYESHKVEASPSKDELLKQLREQLKESDAALQALKNQEKSSRLSISDKLSETDLLLQLKEQFVEPDNNTKAFTQVQCNSTVNEALLLQLREQLLISESSVQTQHLKVKQLQEQLRESDYVLQDALDEKSRFEDEHDKCVREFNQKNREQNRQIERLKSQVSELEATLTALEETNKDKDFEVQELNNRNKKLARDLQEAMDERSRMDGEHEKYLRDADQQTRESNKMADRLKTQISDYEETVSSLDSQIKEKDWKLQELANKHKKMLKELQEKEEERLRAILERDELLSQCEEEKNRFSSLANKMLRRSGNEMSSNSSIIESESLNRVRKLEEELKIKSEALTDAQFAREKAIRDHASTCLELQHALSNRDRAIDDSNRELSLKDVEVRQLKDLLRSSDERLHECDNQMRSEINKLVRQNSDLREKLRMSEDELSSLRSKQSSLRSYSSDERRSQSDTKPSKLKQEISEEVKELRRQLQVKDKEIEKIRLIRKSFDKSDDDSINESRLSRTVTFDQSQFDYKTKSKSNDVLDGATNDVDDYDRVSTSEASWDEDQAHQFRNLRNFHKNRKSNLTIDTTLGLPLDETSYLSIPDGYNGNSFTSTDTASTAKLKDMLAMTRLQLAEAIRELADLKLAASKHIEVTESLEKLLGEKNEENKMLLQKQNDLNRQVSKKEEENKMLLARLREEKQSNNNDATQERSRHRSGEEWDGMSNLSRKELCETVANLKKKLNNADKINDLLKKQVENSFAAEEKKTSNNSGELVSKLSNEVKRLKSELETLQDTKEKDDFHKSCLSRSMPLPSKLPLPKNYKVNNAQFPNPLRSELDRARKMNMKLNNQLAATELTVRSQAEKLNKCRVAFKEAGIVSPPISPLRAARSVPNLYASPQLYSSDKDSSNIDTTRVATQSSENGHLSVSPKSEQKFNSLIQAQAKELSQLREQLQKSRDTCKHLQTEMDIVSRYLKVFLSTTDNVPDPSMISGIQEEIGRSKKLVIKLRRGLSDNVEELGQSEEESDSSLITTPALLSSLEARKIEKLNAELFDKNDQIRRLKEKLEKMQSKTFLKDRGAQVSNSLHPGEKWPSAPNLHPHNGSPHTKISPLLSSKKPSSFGSPHQHELGMMTPASSHLSLHFTSDEEHRFTTSRATMQSDGNEVRFDAMPNSHEKPQRSSWPIERDSSSNRKPMPMYQRTIAVTEYLPPSAKTDRSRSYSAASGTDELSSQGTHHFLPSTDAYRCSASYGGKWGFDGASPLNSNTSLNNSAKNTKSSPWESTRLEVGDSSCDEARGEKNHKLSREVDRLRRRLTDSKRINRSLKEELDFANKTLIQAKESLHPGYEHSSHHDADFLSDHLDEIRTLRQRLEQSIATNDRLREKLEKRLKDTSHGSKEQLSTNIYVATDSGHNSDYHDLEQKVEKLQVENEKLKKRAKADEKAYSTYEDAVKEMKLMQHDLIEKSQKIDRLTQDIQQLQLELKQQVAMTDKLEEKLQSRDSDLSEYKQKLEQVESEKKKLARDKEKANKTAKQLYADVQHSSARLDESRHLINSLKSELLLHEKLQKEKASASHFSPPHSNLNEFLQEIRSLRTELERSIEANSALRKQLEEQLKSHPQDEKMTTINIHHTSPRSKDHSSSNRQSPLGARRKLKLETNIDNQNVLMTPPASASSGADDRTFIFDSIDNGHSKSKGESQSSPTKEKVSQRDDVSKKPFYSKGGPYTLCKSNDFVQLQQTLAKSGLIARTTDNKVAEALKTLIHPSSPETRIIKDVWKSTSSLCHLLDEGDQFLRLFWPVAIPYHHPFTQDDSWDRLRLPLNTGGRCSPALVKRQGSSESDHTVASETDGLRREVGRLRRRLNTQDRLLQTTVERLHNTNKLKEGIEHAIVKQLSRTHDVLRQARGNLEAKAQDPVYRSHHAS